MFSRRLMQMFYDQAESYEDLPWHKPDPLRSMLEVAGRRDGGRVLDVGCGSGNESMFFAERGFDVTGVDFLPQALEIASTRAVKAGLDINWIEADVLNWTPAEPFDVIVDRGCMHGLDSNQLPAYKAQILSWLAPGGVYVLVHFDKRFPLDWHPLGPRRRRADVIKRMLAPELQEISHEREAHKLPFPVSNAVASNFLFQRAG